MEKIINYVKQNYKIKIDEIEELKGGWLNKKYLIKSDDNLFVLKIMSNKKLQKMSNNEFGPNYGLSRLILSLKMEDYMYNNGINCPKIIKKSDGNFVGKLNSEYLFMMEYIKGKSLNSSNVSAEQLYLLGLETAKMHIKFNEHDKINFPGRYLKIPTIEELKNNNFSKFEYINDFYSEYSNLIKMQSEIIEALFSNDIMSEIPIGIVHGDYANDNIIFSENIPYIIDFELVRENSYLQDIGRIILSFCYENNKIDNIKLQAFVKGYNQLSRLTPKYISLSLIVVWINEFDMWIKKSYFETKITPKAKRFQEELMFITYNFFEILDYYEKSKLNSNKKLIKR